MASRGAFVFAKLPTPFSQLRNRPRPYSKIVSTRPLSSKNDLKETMPVDLKPEELEDLLAKPTWSLESLLPPKNHASDAPEISSQQLHHLLRLSALPLPKSFEAEQKMMNTLATQLHFVGEIQQVDTAGVEPLRAIRDENPVAEVEQTITLETLKDALSHEDIIGKHYKRIQRKRSPTNADEVESWDPLRHAERKAGRFFVVESEQIDE